MMMMRADRRAALTDIHEVRADSCSALTDIYEVRADSGVALTDIHEVRADSSTALTDIHVVRAERHAALTDIHEVRADSSTALTGKHEVQMGMKELRKPKIYLGTGGRIRHGLNCVPEFLVFRVELRSDCQIQNLLRDMVCHVADPKCQTQLVY